MHKIALLMLLVLSYTLFSKTLTPSLEIKNFSIVTLASLQTSDSLNQDTSSIDSSMYDYVHDATYLWLANLHKRYMSRVFGTLRKNLDKQCRGFIRMSFLIDNKGKITTILINECGIGNKELCSLAKSAFLTRRYKSHSFKESYFVSFILFFSPDDSTISNIDSLPTFQDFWKEFSKKHPKDRY